MEFCDGTVGREQLSPELNEEFGEDQTIYPDGCIQPAHYLPGWIPLLIRRGALTQRATVELVARNP